MSARLVLLATAIVIAGLIAGLFFGWLVSVIPGLAKAADRTYIETMQSINVAIVNPLFVIPFMITPIILAASAIVEYRAGNQRRSWLLAVATVTYALGVLGVTVGGNIPLNDALDAFDLDSADDAAAAVRRTSYEDPWNRWHLGRTIASVVAFAIATSAALVSEAE